ncbi:MAG: hypothetical protein QNJ62_07825 [Methyloceanibacter sp.]|nr:hypothetical protein [Methyloceanibacter sp.]
MVDEVEKIISRLNGIDPERPYFDPLVVEEAVGRHARLIGFRDVRFTWAMGPQQANEALAGIDFSSSESCLWADTTKSMRAEALAEVNADPAIAEAYQKAQATAADRIAEALHLEIFALTLRNLISGDAGTRGYNVASLVTSVMRDVVANSSIESERLEDLNEAYLPFADALMAGLGSFWIVGERFVCLPLPRLRLKSGALISDGEPAAVWPNGEAYAFREDGFFPALQSVEW